VIFRKVKKMNVLNICERLGIDPNEINESNAEALILSGISSLEQNIGSLENSDYGGTILSTELTIDAERKKAQAVRGDNNEDEEEPDFEELQNPILRDMRKKR
jgi:hypothetical protein